MRRSSHFSLLEIMVVVVIIGIIATMAVTKFVGAGEDAKMRLTKSILEEVAKSLQMVKITKGKYPSNADGLASLTQGSNPILKKVPVDAWDNEIHYQYPGDKGNSPFDLYSYGADGEPGGEGLDADIYYNQSQE